MSYINKLINPVATSNNTSEALFDLEIKYPDTILNRTLNNYYKFLENEEWTQYKGKQTYSVFNMDEYIDEDLNLTVYMKQVDDRGNEIISQQKVAINTIVQRDMFIYTVADLQKMQEYVNLGATYEGKTMYLMRDLDLSSVCSESKGSWTPIGKYVSAQERYSFKGTFEGNNHTISNLYINSTNQFQGLFGITENGMIKNLKISGNVYSTNVNIGVLVGWSSSDIYNITTLVGSTVKGTSSTGVICGVNNGATISNCINNGNVVSTGGEGGGGICGLNANSGIISNCINKGNVTVSGSLGGGVCGGNIVLSTVDSCYNTGNIIVYGADSYGHSLTGGIAGGNYDTSTVKNCYNTGNVTATYPYVAGVVGYNGNSSSGTQTVKNVFNTGTIKKGTTNATSNIGTSSAYAGYLIGRYGTLSGNYANTTKANMASWSNTVITNYLGSSFTKDTKNINEGCPILKWQL